MKVKNFFDKDFLKGWLISSGTIILFYPVVHLMVHHTKIDLNSFLFSALFSILCCLVFGLILSLIIGVDE